MKSDWDIYVPDYGLVRVSEELISKLVEYSQYDEATPESGGVLIGKHLNSGGKVLIDEFTRPQNKDKQGRCLYYRSSEHNKVVLQRWRESNGHSTYLGLWHTHPELIPRYSCVDKQDWVNALNKSKYEGDRLFFFIVGETHIRCWMGLKIERRHVIDLIGDYEFE